MSTTQPEALRENYTAADMATAAAQGFRDGVASVAPLMGDAVDAEFMRQVVAVAVTMLFETHKEDVMRVFSTGELSEIVRITAPLRPQQVEDIYKRAWDALSTPSSATGAAGDAGWRAQFDDWWRRNRVATHQVKNIGGFSAKVWLAAIQTVVGAMDSTAGFYPADEGSTPSRQAIPPSSDKGVAL